MNWFRKFLAVALIVGLGSGVVAGAKEDQKNAPKTEKKKDKDKKKGGAAATPAPADSPDGDAEKNPKRIQVPVPPGHDAKGLVIPYRDGEGKMQMRFTMEIGKRVDPDHMDMTVLRIETFNEKGNKEMTIDLPRSLLDLNTRVITTENGVTVTQQDPDTGNDKFQLTGKKMHFNTDTKQGEVSGNVRMLIYDLENETDSKQ